MILLQVNLPVLGVSFVGGFYVVMIAVLAGLVVLFATASRLGPRVGRALNGISVVALLVFGLLQIWNGLAA